MHDSGGERSSSIFNMLIGPHLTTNFKMKTAFNLGVFKNTFGIYKNKQNSNTL
jgi:hypothetical protein